MYQVIQKLYAVSLQGLVAQHGGKSAMQDELDDIIEKKLSTAAYFIGAA